MLKTKTNLNTEQNAALLQIVDNALAGLVLLVEGLLEQDTPAKRLANCLWTGEKQIAISHAIVLVILDIHRAKALANGAR